MQALQELWEETAKRKFDIIAGEGECVALEVQQGGARLQGCPVDAIWWEH